MIAPGVYHLYLLTFAAAAVGCLGAAWRAKRYLHGDVRRGLVSLFVVAGLWATLTVGQLVASTGSTKATLFTLGLVVGFACVGCWLYFVSAYTGRDFHRDTRLRRLAVVGFLVVSGLKLSNGVHGRYFSSHLTTDPFPHLILVRHWPHWLIICVAYVLVGGGFVLLARMYARSGQDTGGVTVLAGVAALPVGLDVGSVLRPDLLLALTYEPIGVAAFAVGSLFVLESDSEQLRLPARTQLVDDLDDPVVVLDEADVVADYNPAAAALFAAVGDPLVVNDPAPAAVVGFDAETTEVPTVMRVDGRERHFLVRTSPVELGPHEVGRVRVFTDVTRFVTQQRDLGRQRREMDNIAEAVAHELRNDLNIAAGYAELLGDRLADDADPSVARSVDAVATAHRRMDDVIDDLTTLAELAQSTRHVEPHAFATVVDRARSRVEASGVEITVEGEGAIVAEVTRLTELLAKLFEHATDRDATTVAVALTEGGFVVRHDGRPLPSDAADSAFEYGTAVTEGIGLANARALARVHGWSLTLSTTPTDETEIVASGVETGPPPAGAESASAPTSAAERGRP